MASVNTSALKWRAEIHGEVTRTLVDNQMARPKYFEEISQKSSQRKQSLSKKLEGCFGGDARVHDFCRTFTRAELKLLNTGVAQRGEAIRSFLEDHLSGKKNYLRSKLMPLSVAKRIFNRNPFPPVSITLIANQLQFFYGPDIIRDSKGHFRVLEDNVGYVGGFGDLNAFQKAAEIIRCDPKQSVEHNPLYSKMVTLYQAHAKLYGNKKILLLSYPRKHRANREDYRLAAVLKDYGIKEITSTNGLVVRGKNLFHQGERVSFLITNVDVKDIEEFTPKNTISLFASSVSGFWAAFMSGGFGLSSHPASECASDKEFYLYVEKMIRFYLKANPILRNIKTRSLASVKNRANVFGNLDHWVIKSAIGQGGSNVWIGKTLSSKNADRLRQRVDAKPFNFVAQAFTELSRLDGYSVDARPLSIISSKETLVSDLPWGRGAFASKPRKVNLCSGGLFVISDHKRM